jgi:DNA-binding MurR/RpiR family transcriptional regulator
MPVSVLEERTRQNYNTLTKRCKKVAEYLLSNMEDAAFADVAHLSGVVQVSETTVIRFARAIGYEGFTQMQKDLRTWLKEKVSPQEKMERSTFRKSQELFQRIIEADIENLHDLRKGFFADNIERVIERIVRSRHLNIMGYRTSFPMAALLHMFLIQIMPHAELVDVGGGAIYDRIAGWGKEDMLVAFSFPRYSRLTFEIAEYAKRRNCTLVAVTDTLISPIGRIADIVLQVNCKSPSFFNSLVPCTSLINCIAGGVGLLKQKGSIDQLKQRDEMIKELNILV